MKLPTPPQITLGLLAITAVIFAEMNSARADIVHLDDVIIDGSACIGFDCVNGESFGFDTLRLKENNLRINFTDTSTSASFPTRDWTILVNDSSNGGLDRFSIQDITGGRIPVTVEGNAPSNSLYVDDGGRLGLGTNTPVVDVHIKSGNTPTLRLEQDGSSGFTPQTWDVAGNEANFFVRDATGGSTLPFRIYPGAPSNALNIEGSTGDIGLGTTSPDAGLHLVGDMLLEEADSGAAPLGSLHIRRTTAGAATMLVLENNGDPRIRQTDTSTGNAWQLRGGANWEVRLASTLLMQLDTSGNVTFTGTVTPMSDRDSKENFADLSGQEILDKVAALPVKSWNYIADDDEIRHIGPVAQDFHKAFQVGKDDKGISVTDSAGVALISIKALNEKVEKKDVEIRKLEDRLAKLEKLLEKGAK